MSLQARRPLILDTHVLLWALYEPERLGRVAHGLLADGQRQCVIGYFSLWEIKLKALVGKLSYDDRIFDDMAEAGMHVVYPGRQALETMRVFNADNKDPFDNLLLAAALEGKYDALTADNKILDTTVKRLRLIDARE